MTTQSQTARELFCHLLIGAAATALACDTRGPGGLGSVGRAGALDAHIVGVSDALTKIRPDAAVPAATTAELDAARNEFEPFQIVVAGGAAGLDNLTAVAADLTGPDGARIPAANLRLYQVGLYHVTYASNVEGAAGEWPDPLIPDVDPYFGEKRNGLPFDVAANTTRAIWVDLYVPRAIPAGRYSGSVTVSANGLPPTPVAVALRVRNFDLPSTASLTSAFGFAVDNACRAHHGTTYCTGNADAAPLIAAYGRSALEHRISFWDPYYKFPTNGDFTGFDADVGPLLSGTAPLRLDGARMTATALGTRDAGAMASTRKHFADKGWRAPFDYTCDEPPATCAFSDIPTRAAAVHAAGLRTMVTTDLSTMAAHAMLDDIDIVCPVIDSLQPAGAADNRAAYDSFLARSPAKELWTYQSCDQHGCGNGCSAGQASSTTKGWPSYMIDASALQNRAMQWLDFKLRASGELYFETLMHLDDAWNSHVAGHDALCDFGGNGDGALYYPGTPARIGGTHDIPVESMRLQLIREGMEDYEYLHLLTTLGGEADARAAVAALFPAAWKVTQATPAQLVATRAHLADLIEARLGGAPPPIAVGHTDVPVDVHGDGAAFAAATPIVVDAAGAHATFRLLWDAAALYVAADVSDATLSAIGTGADGELWNADGVELLVDPMRVRAPVAGMEARHVVVTAAADLLEARGAGAGEDRTLAMGSTFGVTTGGSVNGGGAAQGYRVIVAVPWSGLGVEPVPGMAFGADLALNNLDGTALVSADWAAVRPFAQPIRWNALQLAAAATGGDPGGGVGGNTGPADGPAAPTATSHAGCSVTGVGATVGGGAAERGGADERGGALALIALVVLAFATRRQFVH